MKYYQLTNIAESDISDIYEYGIRHFGLENAANYLLGMHEQFEMLVVHPEIGRSSNALMPGLKRLSYQSHVIFYLRQDECILVIRVLRAEMDFERHI